MNLKFEEIQNFKPACSDKVYNLRVSYEIFGQALHTAPIVLVNHALTGNSDVANEQTGWWREIIGFDKVIDLNIYTVIAFNIPGNGYDGNLIEEYKAFIAKDIAKVFQKALEQLNIDSLYAIIGGSLGGGIAWEMATLFPNLAKYIIPVASNYISNDWIIGHNYVQESILLNSSNPLEDARKMAMLFYRSPQSINQKFKRTQVENCSAYNVESWLEHHGNKLRDRFERKAYLFMNHLLTTVDATLEDKSVEESFKNIKSTIIQIIVNTDWFFTPDENLTTKQILDDLNIPNQLYQIESIDGHDAFLIEHEQLTNFLNPLFKQ